MKKLLVVDDEEEIRQFLLEFFEARDYTVVIAGTKEEACRKAQEERPHVALLDVRMRNQGDGLDVLKWIREQKLKVKIIMVTAIESQDVVQQAISLGADDYITKPLSLEYLESSVSKKVADLMTNSE